LSPVGLTVLPGGDVRAYERSVGRLVVRVDAQQPQQVHGGLVGVAQPGHASKDGNVSRPRLLAQWYRPVRVWFVGEHVGLVGPFGRCEQAQGVRRQAAPLQLESALGIGQKVLHIHAEPGDVQPDAGPVGDHERILVGAASGIQYTAHDGQQHR